MRHAYSTCARRCPLGVLRDAERTRKDTEKPGPPPETARPEYPPDYDPHSYLETE